MLYFVAGCFALTSVLTLITFLELQSVKMELESMFFRRQIAEEPSKTPDVPEIADEPVTDSIDASELTETELLIIEREAEFDLRIAKMKEELAYQQAEKRENPTEAVSLHPLVQNLPHHIIKDTYDSLPDVEITY